MTNASGLAASIRGSVESSTFDLAGQNVSTITTNIQTAFKDPFPISEMIRITFVTGAGKLARQKYDADAAKAVTSQLRELGFEEDRGASCIVECAGCFKLQHDTGKNLKTCVVFPRIQATVLEDAGQTNSDAVQSETTTSSTNENTVDDMIINSSLPVFERMVKNGCPSWSEKKGCMVAITSIKTKLGIVEQKLFSGNPLTDIEQNFYDSVSSDAMEEKQNVVKDLMHKQVDEGSITSQEKSNLLLQVNERLDTVSKELLEANGKKKEKLTAVKEKVEARKAKLSNIAPQKPHRLKHEVAILSLRTELQPLLELEGGTSGRLLSLKETKILARKDEIIEEIAQLEKNSQGWFEDDESFALRLEACNESWLAQSKQKGKKAAAKKSTSSASSAWVTTTATRPTKGKSKATSSSTASKKTKGKGVSGVFAAMMLDSDSD